MKYILGISLGYNTSACIMGTDQKVYYAASEERFTNKKNTKEFPLLSILNGIKFLDINPKDIIICHYCHYQNPDIYDLYRHSYHIDDKLSERNYDCNDDYNEKLERHFIKQQLYMLGIDVEKVKRINHHHAHANCAYNLTPFKHQNNLYVIMDGFGDGDSISFWVEKPMFECSTLEKIYSEGMSKSIALVYQFVTGALGYKEHQHEGKLTGLAAFGDKTKYYDQFWELYRGFENIKHSKVNSPIIDFDIFTEMKKRTYEFVNDIMNGLSDREKFEESKHVAASLQLFAENATLEYIKKVIKKNNLKDINVMLAGGLFANVKINQAVHEQIPEVKNIFVAPPMGDEGTSIGAACGKFLTNEVNDTMNNMTMRMGTSHSENEIFKEHTQDTNWTRFNNLDEVAQSIAKDLSENKIVCLFDGRMEFGPRALIGRSVIYNCRDKGANDWLNKQLGRTEFMPFAPFCKEEHMTDLFMNTQGKEFALKNMTVTVNCTDEFIQNYPAACHVDNTARPQVISHDENKLAWAILDEYESITGEKALINTSFNLHNYPIVESPKVAIESWLTSNTDCLYIGGDGVWFKITRK